MREENFWCKKPRYSEVRVIARRVIARYDWRKRSLVEDPAVRKVSWAADSDFLFGPNYIGIRGCFKLILSENMFYIYRAMIYFHFGA